MGFPVGFFGASLLTTWATLDFCEHHTVLIDREVLLSTGVLNLMIDWLPLNGLFWKLRKEDGDRNTDCLMEEGFAATEAID